MRRGLRGSAGTAEGVRAHEGKSFQTATVYAPRALAGTPTYGQEVRKHLSAECPGFFQTLDPSYMKITSGCDF